MFQVWMTVILPIFFGSLFVAFNNLLKRYAMKGKTFSTLQFTTVMFGAVTILFSVLYLAVWGLKMPDVMPRFWNAVIGGAAANIFIQFFNAKAASIDKGEVSLTAPLQSMTPGLVTGLGILLGEWPGRIGAVGVLSMIAGSYVLLSEKNKETGKYNYSGPLKRLLLLLKINRLSPEERNKTLVVCMAFGSAAMGTIGLLFDGLYVRRGVNIQGLVLASTALVGILFLTYLIWYLISPDANELQKANGWRELFSIKKMATFGGLSIAITFGLIWISHILLIQPVYNKEYVAYVGTLKRFSIPFSVFLGYMLFNEGDFKKRMWAAILILLGAVFISFDGLPSRISTKIEWFGI